jgi:hypothetical protein
MDLSIILDKPNPFRPESLSKGVTIREGFDKLSPNGVMSYGTLNNSALPMEADHEQVCSHLVAAIRGERDTESKYHRSHT